MSATRLPSDRAMRAERLAGRFICQCRTPIKVRIAMWDGYECRFCWRPILPQYHAVELIRRTLDAVDEP